MKRLALLLLLVGGCHRAATPAPAPVIGEIRAKFEGGSPLAHPSDDELLADVRIAAEAAGGPRVVVPAPAGTPALRLTVEIELGWQKATLQAAVRAHLQPIVVGGGKNDRLPRIDRDGLVEKEDVPANPNAAAVRAHEQHALGLVVGAAMHGAQLWLGPPATARAAISGKDDELRDEGLRIAAERRDHDAVPAILPLLASEDIDVRDRAIGALAEIGDTRATKPLTALAKFGDVEQLVKIIDALSRIGGTEAIAYLEFVGSGHPIPEVRDLAKKALEHVRGSAKAE